MLYAVCVRNCAAAAIELKGENTERIVVFIKTAKACGHMTPATLGNFIGHVMFDFSESVFVWTGREPPALPFFKKIREIQKEYADLNCRLCNILLYKDISSLQADFLDFCRRERFDIVMSNNNTAVNAELDFTYENRNSSVEHSILVDPSGDVYSCDKWTGRKGIRHGNINESFYRILRSMIAEKMIANTNARKQKMVEKTKVKVTRDLQPRNLKYVYMREEEKEIAPTPSAYRDESDSYLRGSMGAWPWNCRVTQRKKQRKEIEFGANSRKKKRKRQSKQIDYA